MKKTFTILAALLAFSMAAEGCYSGTEQIAKNAVRSSEAATKTSSLSRETGSHVVKSKAGSETINVETTAAKLDLASALQTGDTGPLQSANLHLDNVLTANEALSIELDAIEKIQARIITLQESILKDQANTTVALTSTEDKEGSLTRNLRYLAWIVGVGGGLIGLWYLGIGPVVRRALNFVGRGIPTPTATAAKMDVESLEDDDLPTSQRERIAVLRATDPAYEAAFKKHKKLKSPPKRKK